MLLRNDLLQYTHPGPRLVRILWISPEQSYAYVFDVAARSAEVELIQLSALLADLRADRARVLPADPYLVLAGQDQLPAKHLELRARAWQIIAPLVAQEPDIYEARLRGQMIAQATTEHGVSHPTIYRYLRRYWQRGQTPNALLPDYGNSGGRGKVRQSSSGVKRGRPRKNSADDGPGMNVDEDIRRTLRVATAHHALTHAKFSRLAAYQQMLAVFFVDRRIDPETGRVLTVPSSRAGEVPSFGQFNYWLDHDDDRPPEVPRRKASATVAAAKSGFHTASAPAGRLGVGAAASASAARASAAAAGVLGAVGAATAGAGTVPGSRDMASLLGALHDKPDGCPGDSFYLDAVRAEVQLVSRADRKQAIGRPLVYLVTDTFSRMVTGLYIGMGEANWPHAMLALANCGADKQHYSQQHGRAIAPAQWPCRHLPATLYANTALVPEWGDDRLLNNFNLRCIAADGGPSDWRAVLEKRFRLLAPAEQGSPCRLDGVLDLGQFTRIVLDCVLYHNQRQALPQAGNATPLQLWDWGVAHRAGKLKIYPEHLLRCSLLPTAAASVTAAGIALNGSLYTCARAIDEHWFERARLRGEWSVTVACDPSCMDTIYLLDTPMQFHACHLVDASVAHARLSAVEIAHLPRLASPSAVALRSTTQNVPSLVG